tara:strand:+ start:150 stop:788 length:639 start_codon:yes stop_codon:yes gene_type:complete
MCGSFELKAGFEELPTLLKKDLPKGLKEKYAQQNLLKPSDPVLVIKNEGRITTSLMLWGFVSEWSKDPFNSLKQRPFNARSETVSQKALFRTSWRYKRCLLPATGFFEKGYRIKRKDSKLFWIGGIWNRWMSKEGSELETCCILTTNANQLISQFHKRMPVIIPYGAEENWLEPIKNEKDMISLNPLLHHNHSNDWVALSINQSSTFQMNLF